MSVLFYKLRYLHNANVTESQYSIISTVQNQEDLQGYLYTFSKIGKNIQDDIDMTVTDGGLNDARVRLFEIVLKDISKFDAKDMMIGSLLRETEN